MPVDSLVVSELHLKNILDIEYLIFHLLTINACLVPEEATSQFVNFDVQESLDILSTLEALLLKWKS